MPTETVTETTPVTETCDNCEIPVDECDCAQCEACDSNRHTDDICSNCERCTYNGCCNCWHCSRCDRHYSVNAQSPCSNCERCEGCCECYYCESCENNVSEFDSDCERCVDCCNCVGEDSLQFIPAPRNPEFHEAGRGEFKLNPSKRFISAEIEVSEVNGKNPNTYKAVSNWGGAIVSDGSIQGRFGFEINTAPASGDKFLKQIDEICQGLSKDDGRVNKSCGLHVHIDARDFNFYDIRKLVFLYAKIEDAIFSVIAPSRKSSTFCSPCGQKFVKDLENNIVPKDNEKTILKNVYGYEERISSLRTNKYNSARYSALNLHSWVYRGTIECRAHQGTVNAEKIKNWGMLWGAIIDYAANNTEKDIKRLKGDSLSILLSICPNDTVRAWVVARHNHFKNNVVNENTEV